MRRRPLRLAAVLLLLLGLSIALTSGCATTGGGDAGSSPSCPYVSCLSEDGRSQCIAAGCNCDPASGLCQVPEKGPPVPEPVCPIVSCESSAGYKQCVAAGCACSPKTNGCMPVSKG
jgi:hypothetical protein